MQAHTCTIHDFTRGDAMDDSTVEHIRNELKSTGVCVVRLYDDAAAAIFEKEMNELMGSLRSDGGTAHGGRGMGGITKIYGAASHPAAARVRTDPRARTVHAQLYGVRPEHVMSGWDAVACVGTDAARPRAPTRQALEHLDAKKAYHALTGGTLEPHVDIGVGTFGAAMEQKMSEVHGVFDACIQSQFVCKSVPRGGATLVVAPGAYYNARAPDTRLFNVQNGRDFCPCTPEGYAFFRGKWRAIEAPRGCLILWLSRVPHGNKLADYGVDPERRAVFVAWQARDLVSDKERVSLKRKKLNEVVYTGGSTDHWATHIPKVHRGSHYSNGKQITKVLYTRETPPVYDEALAQRVDDAF